MLQLVFFGLAAMEFVMTRQIHIYKSEGAAMCVHQKVGRKPERAFTFVVSKPKVKAASN